MLNRQITLRSVTSEDISFLARLYRATRRHEVAEWGWPEEQQQLFLHMQFKAQRDTYRSAYPKAVDFIICLAGIAVGRLLIAHEAVESRLIDIALLEECRNLGIGTELIRELLRQCGSEHRALHLRVLQGNPAIRLYERLGLVQSSADSMYVQMEWHPLKTSRKVFMPEQLTVEDFGLYLHTRFRVTNPECQELELTEICDHSNAQLEQFSLIFTGPASPWLEQGLYILADSQNREHEIFLVPIGPDESGMRYEAAFSRFLCTPETAICSF